MNKFSVHIEVNLACSATEISGHSSWGSCPDWRTWACH